MSEQLPVGTIIFDHVSKRYRLGMFGSLRDTLAAMRSRPTDGDNAQRTLWALRDVSFRVEPGSALALVGPNGAGKTTTLKLLSNITRPASGRILVSGRISSLIELGAGFHPELTGRENIYLNGAILGMKRAEIARKINDIIAFAELERFIDTPVKRYSSGMYVRLGFAVAAHVEPDILLVDEVLAVGDASFRHRCTQRMHELQQDGTTIVFVSHNMHQVRDICPRALLLVQGQIRAEGDSALVVREYEKFILESGTNATANGEAKFESSGNLVLTSIEVEPVAPCTELTDDALTCFRLHYRAATPQPIGRIVVRILREDSTLCSTADSSLSLEARPYLHQLDHEGTIELNYDPLQLTAGWYTAEVRITDVSDNLVIASGQSSRFQVRSSHSNQDWGVFLPCISWKKQAVITEVGEEQA
jgi:ABC-type polysaccharide/polyol phosphate transport system ATPase subunit